MVKIFSFSFSKRKIYFIENNENEEEYHRTKLLNDHSSSNSDTEQLVIASTSAQQLSPYEPSLLTSPNIRNHCDNVNEEEQSKQLLLEQSDSSEKKSSSSDDETNSYRPTILLKRISQADAERYMPSAWQNSKKQIFVFFY
jgi:hypothetical protein